MSCKWPVDIVRRSVKKEEKPVEYPMTQLEMHAVIARGNEEREKRNARIAQKIKARIAKTAESFSKPNFGFRKNSSLKGLVLSPKEMDAHVRNQLAAAMR